MPQFGFKNPPIFELQSPSSMYDYVSEPRGLFSQIFLPLDILVIFLSCGTEAQLEVDRNIGNVIILAICLFAASGSLSSPALN